VIGPDTYELFAVRYAERDGVRGEHFLGHDARAGETHPTAYFVWLARAPGRTILIDAGMGAAAACRLDGMRYAGTPLELAGTLGVWADAISLTLLTHLHYDHTGMVDQLPRSTFVVQQREWAYWNGPWPERIRRESWLSSRHDLGTLAAARAEGRLGLVEGDVEVAPGVSVHLVGGHTPGMQVVRVNTVRGQAVIASDASHFYENLEDDRPSPLVHDMTGVYGAFDTIRALCRPEGFYLPGHDPGLMRRHPDRAGRRGHIAVIA
jgi:glyoxylase-like metal-dependent hydrolase (beta-lactamase superfamily II)